MRAPQHAVATTAFNVWTMARWRGGLSKMRRRFPSPESWRDASIAGLRQVAEGCRMVADPPPRMQIPHRELWAADCAELLPIVLARIVSAAATDGDGYVCGVSMFCGTLHGYSFYGGRCGDCREAYRVHLRRMQSRFNCGDIMACEGSVSGWQRGCREEPCMDARRVYAREWAAKARAKFKCQPDPDADERCGESRGWDAGGRCDACKAAHAGKQRAWDRNRRVAAELEARRAR